MQIKKLFLILILWGLTSLALAEFPMQDTKMILCLRPTSIVLVNKSSMASNSSFVTKRGGHYKLYDKKQILVKPNMAFLNLNFNGQSAFQLAFDGKCRLHLQKKYFCFVGANDRRHCLKAKLKEHRRHYQLTIHDVRVRRR